MLASKKQKWALRLESTLNSPVSIILISLIKDGAILSYHPKLVSGGKDLMLNPGNWGCQRSEVVSQLTGD